MKLRDYLPVTRKRLRIEMRVARLLQEQRFEVKGSATPEHVRRAILDAIRAISDEGRGR